MSTATEKRHWKIAMNDAVAFTGMIPRKCYERLEIAGSVRRRRAECGDIELVVIPSYGEADVNLGLFVATEPVNLLWHWLDQQVGSGEITKAIYGTTGFRWGEKYRGCEWNGTRFEFFASTPTTWGSTLAIRTGPADLGPKLVMGLRRNGLRNIDGAVWRCDPCDDCRRASEQDCGDPDEPKCPKCGDTMLTPRELESVFEEHRYFDLCGIPYVAPSLRDALERKIR